MNASPNTLPVHHFTIDVEEYFQVSAFESVVDRDRWGQIASRVEASTDRLLALLQSHDARATCFILGWIAERHPQLVRRIAAAGHEIASHGWDHRRVTTITPAEFRSSVRDSKALLEDISGQLVRGFRAPSFSIVAGGEWALEVLAEEGYRYDSSLFPVRRSSTYGHPGAKRDPHWLEMPNGRLAEFPPTTLRRLGVNLPAAGGAYFRLFPYALVRAGIRQSERRGVPATFYIHPWELDPRQPRMTASFATRVRHYGGLGRVESRVERLLREFRFRTIAETVAQMSGSVHTDTSFVWAAGARASAIGIR